jgi:hypothetical protein
LGFFGSVTFEWAFQKKKKKTLVGSLSFFPLYPMGNMGKKNPKKKE